MLSKAIAGSIMCVYVCSAVDASGQQPSSKRSNSDVESVTVTGTRSREVLENFVQSFVVPSRYTGKITRWETPICPHVTGLPASFSKFIVARLRKIADDVGAPVNKRENCKPNLDIVFTTAPQALLNNIRKSRPELIGYSDNTSQAEKLATVTRPIQAWYSTATTDLRGTTQVDSSKHGAIEVLMPAPGRVPPYFIMQLPSASAFSVTGSHIGNGLHSSFHHVIVVANPDQLKTYEIGALADYVTMVGLTQLQSLDLCQQLPTVISLLAVGCSNQVTSLTHNDMGYLRGIYKFNADLTLGSQQNAIAYYMEKESGEPPK